MCKQASATCVDELEGWLRLSHSEGIGPARGRLLLQRFGLPQAVLQAGPGAVADALRSSSLADALFRQDPDRDCAVAGALRWLDGAADRAASGRDWHGPMVQRHILTLTDPRYPPRLLDLADPPLVLYCVGDPAWLCRPQVAIVGSRNATAIGAATAHAFAASLVAAGWTITSGLAEGIDRAAHQGALAAATAGAGTVAALGTGIHAIYPSRHRQLAMAIAAAGALVTEQPYGMPPLPANFPRRNRLIAALASGVLVVEANLRSGSLITARLAAELGREVLAVPGSIHSPLARGGNSLIRQGATLVETAQDVLAELPGFGRLRLRSAVGPDACQGPGVENRPDIEGRPDATNLTARGNLRGNLPRDGAMPEERGLPKTDGLSGEQARMLAMMSADPVMLETLAARQELPIGKALAALQTLELSGLVQRQLDGSYIRCP